MSTRIIAAAQHEEFAPVLMEIYKRAATEPDFRQLALNDSKEAFDAVGGELADDWKLKFVESGKYEADDILVLPPPIEASAELTEEELVAVAGGQEETTAVCVAISTVASAAISAAISEIATENVCP